MPAQPSTSRVELDRLLARLTDRRRAFAQASLDQKTLWLRETRAGFARVSAELVQRACAAKRIEFAHNVAAEEWLSGPGIILRHLRLYEESLARRRFGGSTLGPRASVSQTKQGRTRVDVLPVDNFDRALFMGFHAETRFELGVEPGDVQQLQAVFYDRREPEGGVSLVLGAGNIVSIPVVDALHTLFVRGQVCLLKLNPVNEYLGSLLEEACKVLIELGYLAVAYGGGEVGEYLCQHPNVDDIHITGSDKTHDLIVWGPPGEERSRRQQQNEPRLNKPITSELGNISPAIVTPAQYTDTELRLMARNVVGTFVLNAGFNCNATKLLVLAQGWPQGPAFLKYVGDWLSLSEPRFPYYPGSRASYERLTHAHGDVRKFGDARADTLPWALACGVEAAQVPSVLSEEPFCALLTQTEVGSTDPEEFFRASTDFLNKSVPGTLNAMVLLPARVERDPRFAEALENALEHLRYGVIGVNHWPAAAFGMGSIPWGGYPGATLLDVQSGIGFVHNTFMLERIEKSILRGPFSAFPLPMWFPGHRTQREVAQKFCEFEADPSWFKIAGLAASALGA